MWIVCIVGAVIVSAVMCFVYPFLYKSLFGESLARLDLMMIERVSITHGNEIMPYPNFASLSWNVIQHSVLFIIMVLIAHFLQSWWIVPHSVMLINAMMAWTVYKSRKRVANLIAQNGININCMPKLLSVYKVIPIYTVICYIALFIIIIIE